MMEKIIRKSIWKSPTYILESVAAYKNLQFVSSEGDVCFYKEDLRANFNLGDLYDFENRLYRITKIDDRFLYGTLVDLEEEENEYV